MYTTGNNFTVGGNLVVQGDTTTLNTATLTVEDKEIVIASGAANSSAADGAGLTVDGASATILYDHKPGYSMAVSIQVLLKHSRVLLIPLLTVELTKLGAVNG